jgi:hypothetical protein
VCEEYFGACASKPPLGAKAASKLDGFRGLKRWLEMRVKYAGFIETLDLMRVCLHLPLQNLANKCFAKFSFNRRCLKA